MSYCLYDKAWLILKLYYWLDIRVFFPESCLFKSSLLRKCCLLFVLLIDTDAEQMFSRVADTNGIEG